MKRHTVGAGIVAAVVIACTEPGMEATGRLMRDAGEAMADAGRRMGADAGEGDAGVGMLADAGEMLLDAGRMLSDAGGALAGSGGGGGASDAQAQEPSDGLPRAHWVLRDRDGTPVKADFYVYDEPKDLFASAAVDCIAVHYFGSRYIGGQYYRLSDGAFGACYPMSYASESWRRSALAVFGPADDTCSGPGLSTSGYFGAIPLRVGGTFYYVEGAPVVSTMGYYRWNQTTQACEKTTSSTPVSLWAFKPTPADVVGLLSKPPYSVELVY